MVTQLTELERAPQARLRSEQSVLEQQNNAFGSLVTQMNLLKSRVDALKDPALFNSHATRVGDSTIASASASAAAAVGLYTFHITQVASASAQQGGSNVASPLSATNDVSGLVLSNASLATAITAGTFTVNGRRVSLETTDTLQAVFDKISTATGGAVTGSYDSATDKITFSSASPIVLGSATDTSNFLQVAKLYNNGTGTVRSDYALGVVKQSATLGQAHLAVAITDGGSGAGQFKVNGVAIDYSASTDTVADVLARINNSSAGVTATYDTVNDRFVLTNKATGDLGLALEDVTGNFLAATQLSTGTLNRGHNLLYTVNNGPQLTSLSNSITESSSAIAGLTVTSLKEGTTTVEVATDTAKIKTAINDFITEYNKAQSMIESQTASSTDAKGKVRAALLTGDRDAYELASKLRGLVNAVVSGLTGTVSQLDDLGIVSNGNDNLLSLSDTTKLEEALTSHLNEVEQIFTDSTNGLAVQLSAYLDASAGDEGTVIKHQGTLSKQITDIDTQIADMERIVLANQQRLIDSFIVMEKAQAAINQQMQYLSQQLGLQ